MGAGVLQGLGDGGGSAAEDVLFLVPELLFLAFMAVVALGAGLRLVASRRRTQGSPCGSRAPGLGGGARLGRFPAVSVGAARTARTAVVAAIVVPVLLRSVRTVVGAPVADSAMAATLAAAVAGLAVVGVVVLAAVVEAAAVVLERKGTKE